MSKGFKTLHEETFSLPFIMQTSYGDFKIETTQFYNPNKEINVKVSFPDMIMPPKCYKRSRGRFCD